VYRRRPAEREARLRERSYAWRALSRPHRADRAL